LKRALVIYSGGLDTTVSIPLLGEEGFDEVYTVTVDVGQPEEDIRRAEERAKALGTCHTTVDAKETFASEYCAPAIQFNADYFGYPLSTAIARPLIARCAADVAKEIGKLDAVVHGCTGKGNDQFRIEFGLRLHLPDVPIRAPIREKNWTRSAEIEYAQRVGVPIAQSKDKICSIDENLWGRSIEGGRLEDPNYSPPEEIFEWTVSPTDAPDAPEQVVLSFEGGVPVALNGGRMNPLRLIRTMHELAGRNGIGRIDMMEDRMIGLKVRENYECPAAVVLIQAHRALEALVTAPHERRFKALVDAEWADLVYKGLWGDPLFDDLMAFNAPLQSRVTGEVSLTLYKGAITVTGRTSPWALYNEADASFDDDAFDQSEMAGMVRTHGMASLLYQRLKDRLQS